MLYSKIHAKHVKTDPASQEEAKRYVLERELYRPKTTKKTPIILAILMVVVPLPIGFLLFFLCEKNSLHDSLKVLSFVIPYIISILIFGRFIAITSILCYQHYADEEVRRLCLCKPTCSEYAILVLKKYPIFIAIFKIIYRLNVTCTGTTYKIDEP